MARSSALAAFFRGLEPDGKLPLSESHAFSYEMRLLGSVCIMTKAAAPALFAIDMQPMKIEGAIAKVRRCEGLLGRNQPFLMARKAKIILFLLIVSIKSRGMRFGQQLGKRRTMGGMTVLATPFLQGLVAILAL